MTITFPDRLRSHTAHRFARTMSIGPADSTDHHPVACMEPERPRIFSIGSHAQRLRQLHAACALLALAFVVLDVWYFTRAPRVRPLGALPLAPRLPERPRG